MFHYSDMAHYHINLQKVMKAALLITEVVKSSLSCRAIQKKNIKGYIHVIKMVVSKDIHIGYTEVQGVYGI